MLLDGFDSSNSTQNLKSKCKKYLYYNWLISKRRNTAMPEYVFAQKAN